MTPVRLVALFWHRGGTRQLTNAACTAFGIAAATVLALLVLSVPPALSARADREAWHLDGEAIPTGAAPMLRRVVDEGFRDRTITRVDLAATGRGTVEAPPGLRAFPAPGEVWMSPALARLVDTTPADELGDRWPRRSGTVGAAGLAHADDLLVIVGREPAALAPDDDTVGLDRFARSGTDSDLDDYVTLAQMAAVLLVVPTLGLIGAAARLTAAQREQRLAVLRLVGAPPSTVVAITAIDTAVAALAGTAVGIVGYLAVLPAVRGIPLAGGPFSVADLRLPASALAAALAVVPAIAATTAVAALRGVVAGPLGVRRRTTPARPSLLRFLVVPVAWFLFVGAAGSMRDGGGTVGMLIGLAAVIGSLTVIGPWITWLLGAGLRAVARGPATTIAARRTIADPKGAYRTVSGMVLAGLIAGFLFGVLPTLRGASLPEFEQRRVWAEVPLAEVAPLQDAIAAIPGATMVGGRTGPDRWEADLTASGTHLDRVRTAVSAAAPGARTEDDGGLGDARTLLDDLGRASVIMSIAALVLAAAAIGIGTAANLLDQRDTLARLRLIGVPTSALQRARRWQVLLPLATASIGAMTFGAVAGLTLLYAFGASSDRVEPPAVTELAALGVAGIAVGLLVVAATRPLLERVSRANPRT